MEDKTIVPLKICKIEIIIIVFLQIFFLINTKCQLMKSEKFDVIGN